MRTLQLVQGDRLKFCRISNPARAAAVIMVIPHPLVPQEPNSQKNNQSIIITQYMIVWRKSLSALRDPPSFCCIRKLDGARVTRSKWRYILLNFYCSCLLIKPPSVLGDPIVSGFRGLLAVLSHVVTHVFIFPPLEKLCDWLRESRGLHLALYKSENVRSAWAQSVLETLVQEH